MRIRDLAQEKEDSKIIYNNMYMFEKIWKVFFTPQNDDCRKFSFRLDFCLTVHHQLGKVIQMNQLDATMIYWSLRSAQHVSGNILPIIRSVRQRFLQHMVSCCCGCGTIVPRCRSPSPCPPQQQDTICCKNLSLTLLMMGKIFPETCWADLIDQ